jgi:hypothetical protein
MFESLNDFSKDLQKIIETNTIYEKKLDKIENLIYAIRKNEDWMSEQGKDETRLKFINMAIEEIEKVLEKDWRPKIDPKAKVRLTVVDED